MFRTSCLICGSANLKRIMDLGMHPFADTFISSERLSESEPVYPLICDMCLDCGQIQTSCVTDPQARYSLYDYSYTSSNSAFSRGHWEEYAVNVSKKLNLDKGTFVVEIGSNDGYLSEQFQKIGYKVTGVDPSQYMAYLAEQRGVDTVIDFFNMNVAEQIVGKYGNPGLIVANNVFNHSDSPLDFAKAAARLIGQKGTFVFELPYWFAGLQSKKFDQIYHEHVSYFTVRSSAKILKLAGLAISDVEIVNYHGGSIRVFARSKDDLAGNSRAVNTMIEKEFKAGVFEPKTYDVLMEQVLRQRNELLKKLYDIKSKGSAIIAVGAAAKGNTFLNFYNLDSTVVSYVTDSSPHKQGKYTPLTRIPICGDEVFADHDDVYALILSWNISEKLEQSLCAINPLIKFITLPTPKPKRNRRVAV